MKKLLIILLVIAAVGCKEGGILNDNDVFIADPSAAAVKKVPALFEPTIPMYVADDGGLILVENYEDSNDGNTSNTSKRIAKIMPDGSKRLLQPPKPEWMVYGSISQESVDKFAPKVHTVSNVYKGSDGCFYSLGIEQPRFQEDFKAVSLTKFDGDLNVIYDCCILFPIDVEQTLRVPLANSSTPGAPLDNGRFALILSSVDGWDNPLECYLMTIGADGRIESEFQFDPEFTEITGGDIYSYGDIILYDYNDWNDGKRHIRSFSSQGKFMYEQIAEGKCSMITYTGNNTILTCLKEDYSQSYEGQDGYMVSVITGKYFYTDVTPDLTDAEVNYFNGSDSSYVAIGGVDCSGSRFLYGYCRQNFKTSYSVDYHINESDARGFIMQDGEVYTIAGTSSKAILGVWYNGGTYTIYYDELLRAQKWNEYVTIVKTDDLKKLVF